MGCHEGQVKRVSEHPGQDLGDGVCLDDRALHGMRDGLQRGHRAFVHGEHLEGHRVLMHGGHREGHRAVHFHRDGRELRQGDLQRAGHQEGHRVVMHGVSTRSTSGCTGW